jgi:hypothetical protein
MKFLIMQFSPTSYHFILFRSKYSPQHPVLRHPQSVFFLYCQRPSSLNFGTEYKRTAIFILLLFSPKELDRRLDRLHYLSGSRHSYQTTCKYSYLRMQLSGSETKCGGYLLVLLHMRKVPVLNLVPKALYINSLMLVFFIGFRPLQTDARIIFNWDTIASFYMFNNL